MQHGVVVCFWHRSALVLKFAFLIVFPKGKYDHKESDSNKVFLW